MKERNCEGLEDVDTTFMLNLTKMSFIRLTKASIAPVQNTRDGFDGEHADAAFATRL